MPEHTGKFISYHRVSTTRQGESGLGLEAQQKAVADYLNGGDWELLEEYVETESGKSHKNRPELQKALAACKKHKATLIIAKLDRLARNVAFISKLMESAQSEPINGRGSDGFASYGPSFVSNEGFSKILLYDLPRHPIVSIGDFKNLVFSWNEDTSPRPIGASWPVALEASPF